ncbi:ADP-ribosylglycohydrolase [Chthonomonas calidirosea]|uniref:ADP-ribosylglycohydrolase family protein n=1 Tax=Chthonomonas calidirosea TaxID=454171 RepID=UPI0006DD38C1|nr:ADP-ribosylglycohydrolase family protein [Chthonomonas calidirosea]CEK15312.1 ADP-ribosylglycohydrolase [Chthonomonas calidirosea]
MAFLPMPILPEVLRNRFRGVLLGLALGDAFGAPLDSLPPSDPERAVTDLVGGGWLRLAPGDWTDEIELALETANSLLKKQVFDPDDIAGRFVDWYRRNPRTIGEHTRKVLERTAQGTPWEEASFAVYQENPEWASSGSLRRCAPLALFFYHSPQYLPVLSSILSRITHAHPNSEAACVALNLMLAYLVAGLDKETAYREVHRAALELPADIALAIERAGDPSLDTFPAGSAPETLEVALRSLMQTTRFENALIVAVNHGGDAAVVGSITGALAGALHGCTAIPTQWLELLRDRDRLQSLADRLFLLTQTTQQQV